MPWSDDTRCLYCDGKLPLYQKLTHGQFCSKAHQKKYWDEQQQLAVERLHQTHSDIQAYKPPEVVENLGPIGYSSEDEFAASILGPEAVTETPVVNEAYGNDAYDNEAYFTSSFASDFAAKSVVNPVVNNAVVDDYVDDYVDPPVAGFVQSALEPVGERPEFIADDLVGETMEPELAVALPAWVASGASHSNQGLWDLADHVLDSSIPEPASAQAELAPLTAGLTAGPFCERYTAVHALALSVAPLAGIVEPDLPFEFETTELVEVSSSAPSQASPNGLANEAPSDVSSDVLSNDAPPLVRDLSSLTLLPARPERASVMCADIQADLSHIASGRPEIHISNGLASVREHQLPEASLCPVDASVASVSVQPVESLPIGTLEDIGWQADHAQRPSLAALAIPVIGLSEDQIHAIELANAPQPEPEPAVAPLPPETIAGLSELPFNLEIASAPTWTPAMGRSLTPHVEAMLPVDPQVAVVPVVITAEPEAPAVEGPVDIPPQARHVAMQHVLLVQPANSPFKPSPALAVIPEPLEGQNILPRLRKAEIVKVELKRQMAAPVEIRVPVEAPGGIRGFWKKAPRDLKLLACAIPLVVGLAFHSLPKVSVSAAASDGEAPPSRFQQVLDEQFASIKSTVASRAAIALDEDFRGGIDKWISGTGATAEWGFDATGFVNPGPLALYEPSLKLNDYQMQFLGMIDQKAMSWVARAENFENYYVIKLVVLKEGPLPTIGLTRYAVIDGKPVDRVDVPVRIDARPDTIYRVRMEINGDRFSLDVQGRMVDTWEEPRLPRGGVGFFTGRGEKSSIRWVQLTHQYDVLGRLCAFLAPYEF